MSIRVRGLNNLYRKLGRLKRGARPVLRKAVTAGTAVLRTAVRAETPVDEGVLRRAQSSKVAGKGLSLSGIAGADVGKLEADERRPSNIDWLVEYGHVTPDGVFVPPSGHTRRAAASAMPRAESVFVQTLRSGIERAAG